MSARTSGDNEETQRVQAAAAAEKPYDKEAEQAKIREKIAQRQKKCKCLTMTQGVIQNVSHPLRYYEFTQEELKALEQCDKESFYLRCLPMSTGLAALTFGAIRSGLLRSNPHFGPFPKVFFAMMVGYFGGLVASKPLCDEKFRKLPAGSFLGDTMREYHAKMLKEMEIVAKAKAEREKEAEALREKKRAEKKALREAMQKAADEAAKNAKKK